MMGDADEEGRRRCTLCIINHRVINHQTYTYNNTPHTALPVYTRTHKRVRRFSRWRTSASRAVQACTHARTHTYASASTPVLYTIIIIICIYGLCMKEKKNSVHTHTHRSLCAYCTEHVTAVVRGGEDVGSADNDDCDDYDEYW